MRDGCVPARTHTGMCVYVCVRVRVCVCVCVSRIERECVWGTP